MKGSWKKQPVFWLFNLKSSSIQRMTGPLSGPCTSGESPDLLTREIERTLENRKLSSTHSTKRQINGNGNNPDVSQRNHIWSARIEPILTVGTSCMGKLKKHDDCKLVPKSDL